MNLYLFNANDSAAIYGIGSYLRELTQVLKGVGVNIHIVHLHSVRSVFETVKTGEVENWYIPEVRKKVCSRSFNRTDGFFDASSKVGLYSFAMGHFR